MPNLIEHAKIYQEELDKAMLQTLTSGWMEINDKFTKYTGGDEIKIPSLDMDGLGDYDRNGDGAPEGSVDFKYQTVKMSQDRGRMFTFDEHEVNETNFLLTAPAVMGEFQRTKVVPEIDAYRYSLMAQMAGTKIENFIATEANILKQLYLDIATIQDVAGDIPLIVTMSTKVAAMFDLSDKISKHLSVIDFQQGGIVLKVQAINGMHPIRRVSSERMKTSYLFNDGRSEDQKKGGFKPANDAKDINYIISTPDAIRAKAVTDAVRIFDPNTYQKKRAWACDYRKFHDAWIPESKKKLILVNIAPASSQID